jgi:hypothetical protein
MAIDKSLYQAPQGIGSLPETPDLEIEIENPDDVTMTIGGIEIDLMPDRDTSEDFNANLAEEMDEQDVIGCRHTSTVLSC